MARWFSKHRGVVYNETFAPTPVAPSIRLMAAIASKWQLDLRHVDVQQAVVQAELKKVVLARMP